MLSLGEIDHSAIHVYNKVKSCSDTPISHILARLRSDTLAHYIDALGDLVENRMSTESFSNSLVIGIP